MHSECEIMRSGVFSILQLETVTEYLSKDLIKCLVLWDLCF